MERTTRKQVESYFNTVFCPAMGFKVAEDFNDVGAYRLDYYGIYGGFNVERVDNEHGGVSNPFGYTRQKPAVMMAMLRFTLDAHKAATK